jgi:uncharacterized membrane protein (UPF0127 family)
MKRKIFTSIVIAVALLASALLLADYSQRKAQSAMVAGYRKAAVAISGEPFEALVADTDALRERGLGGFKGLGEHQAMIFVFDTPGDYAFWMKDMLFSIDMLWLDQDGEVVSFEESVSPQTYPRSFSPKGYSLYVVELPAGTLARLGVREGDRASLSGLPVGK